MEPGDVKKRKACSTCTKAKAKCSPSSKGWEICQRCERLDKDCVYENSARRRGPRTRSRMKQLEQRVESLMGMLAPNTQPSTWTQTISSTTPLADTTSGASGSMPELFNAHTPLASYITPDESPHQSDLVTFTPYDPILAGIIREDEAVACLHEFHSSFCQQFPFVAVDAFTDARTLRTEQPFLFLAILTVTTYRMPTIQRILDEEFRDQVATRIIGHAHKGLELLQGLLVHTAFYHFFYRPGKQQLTLMVQLCVAAVQDLGVSRNVRAQHDTDPNKAVVEKRAILGTYYLAAEFARTWRKRTTMPYTRSIASHCQSFADRPLVPSDSLIAPLVRLTELMCRVNEYFSYDEIAYSEVTGDATLQVSTHNFRNELQRLLDSMPESARDNTTISLTTDVLTVFIHECSLHNTLWSSFQPTFPSPPSPSHTHAQPPPPPPRITPTRASMLQRTLSASQSFVRKLIATPAATLHHFPFPIWASWFYATLVVVKLIFLNDNNGSVAPGMSSVPCEVGNLLPGNADEASMNDDACVRTSGTAAKGTDIDIGISEPEAPDTQDAALAAREAEIIPTFQAFIEKMLEAAPKGPRGPQHPQGPMGPQGQQSRQDTQASSPDNSLLVSIATLQRNLLAGLKTRVKRGPAAVASGSGGSTPASGMPTTTNTPTLTSTATSAVLNTHPSSPGNHIQGSAPAMQDPTCDALPALPPPQAIGPSLPDSELPSFMSFAELEKAALGGAQAPVFDDWMWDLVMEDVNMFTV